MPDNITKTIGLNVEPARQALRTLRIGADEVTKSLAALTVMLDEKLSSRLGRVLSDIDKQISTLNDTLVSIGTSGKMTGLGVLEKQVDRLDGKIKRLGDKLNQLTIRDTHREIKSGILVRQGSEAGDNLQRANLDMIDTIRQMTLSLRKAAGNTAKLEGTTFTPFDTVKAQKLRIQYVGQLEAAILTLNETSREQTALARQVREVRRQLKQMWRSAGNIGTFANDIKYLSEVAQAIEASKELSLLAKTGAARERLDLRRHRAIESAAGGTDPRTLIGASLARSILQGLVQLEATARKIPSVGNTPISASPAIITEFGLAVQNLGSLVTQLHGFRQTRVSRRGHIISGAISPSGSELFGGMPKLAQSVLEQLLRSLGGVAATLLNQPGLITSRVSRNVGDTSFSSLVEAILERYADQRKLSVSEQKVQRRLLGYNRPYTSQELAYLNATGNMVGRVVPGISAGGQLIQAPTQFTSPANPYHPEYTYKSDPGVMIRARQLWDDLDEFDRRRSDIRRKYEERAGKMDPLGPDYSSLTPVILHEGGRRAKSEKATLGSRLITWLDNAGPEATYALMLNELQLSETPAGILKALRDLTGKSGVYKFQKYGITLADVARSISVAGITPQVDLSRLLGRVMATSLITREQYKPGTQLSANTLYVGRGQGKRNITNTAPGEWGWLGNPLEMPKYTRNAAVAGYIDVIVPKLLTDPKFAETFWSKAATAQVVQCWCKTVEACHGDIVKGLIQMGKPAFEETAKSLPTLREKLLSGVASLTKDTQGSLDIDKIISGIDRVIAAAANIMKELITGTRGGVDITRMGEVLRGTGPSSAEARAVLEGHGVSNFTREIGLLGLTNADLQNQVSPELLARGAALMQQTDAGQQTTADMLRLEGAIKMASTEMARFGSISSEVLQVLKALGASSDILSQFMPTRSNLGAELNSLYEQQEELAARIIAIRRQLASLIGNASEQTQAEALRKQLIALDQLEESLDERVGKLHYAMGIWPTKSRVVFAEEAAEMRGPGSLIDSTPPPALSSRGAQLRITEQPFTGGPYAQRLWRTTSVEDSRTSFDRLKAANEAARLNMPRMVEANFEQQLADLQALNAKLMPDTSLERSKTQEAMAAAHNAIKRTLQEWAKFDKTATQAARERYNAFRAEEKRTAQQHQAAREAASSAKRTYQRQEEQARGGPRLTRQQQANRAAAWGAAYQTWQGQANAAQAAGTRPPPPPNFAQMFMQGGAGGSGGLGGGGGGAGGAGGVPPRGPGGLRGWMAGPNPIRSALFGQNDPQLWRGLLQYAGLHMIVSQLYKVQDAISGSVEKAADFSIQLAQIQTISEDAARQGLEPLSAAVVQVAKDWSQPLAGTADALYQITSDQMGVMRHLPMAFGSQDNLTRSLDFLNSAAEFSRASVTPIAQASEAIASVANSYQMGAGAASQIGAMLFRTIDVGRVTGEQLSGTIGRVMPLGAELGVRPEELLAGIAHQTIMGIKPEESYTLLSNVMLKLLRPTQALKAELSALGIESIQLGVQGKGLQGFLEEITQRSGTAAEAVGELFNQIRGTRGVLTLTGPDAENYKRVLEQIKTVTPEVLTEAAKKFEKIPGLTYQQIKTQFDIFWTTELGPKTLAVFNAVAGLHPQTLGTAATVGGVGLTALIGASAARQLGQMSYAGLEKMLQLNAFMTGLSARGIGASRIAGAFPGAARTAAAAAMAGPGSAASMAAMLNPYVIGTVIAAVAGHFALRALTRPTYDQARYEQIQEEKRPLREERQRLLEIEGAKQSTAMKDELQKASEDFHEAFKRLGATYNQDRTAVMDWAEATTATVSRALQSRVAVIQGVIGQLQTLQQQADSIKVSLRNEMADARNQVSDAVFDRSLRGHSPIAQSGAYFRRAQQYMNAARATDDEDRRKALAGQAADLAIQGYDLGGNERALNVILSQRVQILQELYAQQNRIKEQAKAAEQQYEKGLFKFEQAYSAWQDARTKLLNKEAGPKSKEEFDRISLDMVGKAKEMQTILDDLSKVDLPNKIGALGDRLKLRQLADSVREGFVDPVTGQMSRLEDVMGSTIEHMVTQLSKAYDTLAAKHGAMIDKINKKLYPQEERDRGFGIGPYTGFGDAAQRTAQEQDKLSTLAGQRTSYLQDKELVAVLQDQVKDMRANLIGSWLEESLGLAGGARPDISKEAYQQLYPHKMLERVPETIPGYYQAPITDILAKMLQDPAFKTLMEKQGGLGGKYVRPEQLKHTQAWLDKLSKFEKRLSDIIIGGDTGQKPGFARESLGKALEDFRKALSRPEPSWVEDWYGTQGRTNKEINIQIEKMSEALTKTLYEQLNLREQALQQEKLPQTIQEFVQGAVDFRKAVEASSPAPAIKTLGDAATEASKQMEELIGKIRALRDAAKELPTPPPPTPSAPSAAPKSAALPQPVPKNTPVPSREPFKLLGPGALEREQPLYREAAYRSGETATEVPESFLVTLGDSSIQANAASISDMLDNIKSAPRAEGSISIPAVDAWDGTGISGSRSYSLQSLPYDYAGGGVFERTYDDSGEDFTNASNGVATSLDLLGEASFTAANTLSYSFSLVPETSSYIIEAFNSVASASYALNDAFNSASARLASAQISVPAPAAYASGGDVVPARLTAGEFVTNTRATQTWYPVLRAMNSTQLPRYGEGGSVTNVGDVVVNINGSATKNIDGRAIANTVRRVLRQKTARLT